jgi:hypothetical protein
MPPSAVHHQPAIGGHCRFANDDTILPRDSEWATFIFLQALQLYMIDFSQDLRVSIVRQGVSAVVECYRSRVFGLVSSMYCIS